MRGIVPLKHGRAWFNRFGTMPMSQQFFKTSHHLYDPVDLLSKIKQKISQRQVLYKMLPFLINYLVVFGQRLKLRRCLMWWRSIHLKTNWNHFNNIDLSACVRLLLNHSLALVLSHGCSLVTSDSTSKRADLFTWTFLELKILTNLHFKSKKTSYGRSRTMTFSNRK